MSTQRDDDTPPFPLTLKTPMTVIAVMDCGEALLMGADSLVTEDAGLRVTRPKLVVLPDRPIAFGFSGAEDVGVRFRDWLLTYRWPDGITWPDFGDVASEALSRFNGRRRARARLAGVDAKPDDLASVLVAGSIGGALDVWDLAHDGSAASAKHRGLAVIGSGLAHAFIAYVTLTKWGNQPPNTNTMAVVMEIAVRYAPMCGAPIRLVRLTHDQVTELERGPDNTWREHAARPTVL